MSSLTFDYNTGYLIFLDRFMLICSRLGVSVVFVRSNRTPMVNLNALVMKKVYRRYTVCVVTGSRYTFDVTRWIFVRVKIIDIVSWLKPNGGPGYVSQFERKHAATISIIYYYCNRIFSRIVIDANFPRPLAVCLMRLLLLFSFFSIKYYNYAAR